MQKKLKNLQLLVLLFLVTQFSFGQKVGLVLSGGGASGLAHIGVLMALEEHNIPVDYITGTSAGALIGSLYSIGYSPKQIARMATSEDFFNISTGNIDQKHIYFYKQRKSTSSIVNFELDKNFSVTKLIPLSFTDPSLTDFFMINVYSVPSAVANYNFDSLFIPFRCVASDIDNNEQVVFGKGNLSQAVRASMTYPFYLPPLVIEGKILVDGGLYNNFPSDVMESDFLPDVILGSSVSTTRDKPSEYDLVSQVTSMIQSKSSFEIKCENSLIISPDVSDIGTFSFEKSKEIIQKGYKETIKNMDSIKSLIQKRVNPELLKNKRQYYLKTVSREVFISKIEVSGVKNREKKYIESTLKDKGRIVSLLSIKNRYLRLITDDKIKYIFPVLTKNKLDSNYTLNLRVKKKPEFNVRVGGHFSTNLSNIGYTGVDYKYINRYFSLTSSADLYFGRFYNSLDLSTRIDFPFDFPFYIEPFGTFNRRDYYRSFTSFFEDTKPAYLINNEIFWGGAIGFPLGNKGKISLKYSNGFTENEYYQTKNFLSTDTADNTKFFFNTVCAGYERNSLDNHYFSKKGNKINFAVSFVDGTEINKPGSTSRFSNIDTVDRYVHNWFVLKFNFEQYIKIKSFYNVGLAFDAVSSSQDFFNNYTSSMLMAQQYQPIPETKTLFIDEYTAHSFLGIGLKNVLSLTKKIDLRVEGYLFQPIERIVNDNKKAKYFVNFTDIERNFLASTVLVYHSPIGPVSFTSNYMDYRNNKWSFMLNFNYLFFNRKGL